MSSIRLTCSTQRATTSTRPKLLEAFMRPEADTLFAAAMSKCLKVRHQQAEPWCWSFRAGKLRSVGTEATSTARSARSARALPGLACTSWTACPEQQTRSHNCLRSTLVMAERCPEQSAPIAHAPLPAIGDTPSALIWDPLRGHSGARSVRPVLSQYDAGSGNRCASRARPRSGRDVRVVGHFRDVLGARYGAPARRIYESRSSAARASAST